eukprot:ANDGO_06857.mRNA.1 hypothetical protein
MQLTKLEENVSSFAAQHEHVVLMAEKNMANAEKKITASKRTLRSTVEEGRNILTTAALFGVSDVSAEAVCNKLPETHHAPQTIRDALLNSQLPGPARLSLQAGLQTGAYHADAHIRPTDPDGHLGKRLLEELKRHGSHTIQPSFASR